MLTDKMTGFHSVKLSRFPDCQAVMLTDKMTGFHSVKLPCRQTNWQGFQTDKLPCWLTSWQGFQTVKQTNGQADRRIQLVKLPCRLTNWQGFPTDKLSCCQTDKWTSLQASRLSTKIVILTNWQACSVDWQTSMLSYKQTDRRPLTFSALTFSCTVNAFKSFNVTCSSWPIFYLPHTTRTYIVRVCWYVGNSVPKDEVLTPIHTFMIFNSTVQVHTVCLSGGNNMNNDEVFTPIYIYRCGDSNKSPYTVLKVCGFSVIWYGV